MSRAAPRRRQPRRPAQRRDAASRRPGRTDCGRLRGLRPRRRADADGRPGRADAAGGRRRPDHRQPQSRRVERPQTVRPRRPRPQRRRGPQDPGAVRSRRDGPPVPWDRIGNVRDYRKAGGRAPRARPAAGGRGGDPRRRVHGAFSTPTAAPAGRSAATTCSNRLGVETFVPRLRRRRLLPARAGADRGQPPRDRPAGEAPRRRRRLRPRLPTPTGWR